MKYLRLFIKTIYRLIPYKIGKLHANRERLVDRILLDALFCIWMAFSMLGLPVLLIFLNININWVLMFVIMFVSAITALSLGLWGWMDGFWEDYNKENKKRLDEAINITERINAQLGKILNKER